MNVATSSKHFWVEAYNADSRNSKNPLWTPSVGAMFAWGWVEVPEYCTTMRSMTLSQEKATEVIAYHGLRADVLMVYPEDRCAAKFGDSPELMFRVDQDTASKIKFWHESK